MQQWSIDTANGAPPLVPFYLFKKTRTARTTALLYNTALDNINSSALYVDISCTNTSFSVVLCDTAGTSCFSSVLDPRQTYRTLDQRFA